MSACRSSEHCITLVSRPDEPFPKPFHVDTRADDARFLRECAALFRGSGDPNRAARLDDIAGRI